MAPAMKNTRKHCFVSTEQRADEAKEVLDKANFFPAPATWGILVCFCHHIFVRFGVHLPEARKQTHLLDQLLVFKNGLHLSTFIGVELYITSMRCSSA